MRAVSRRDFLEGLAATAAFTGFTGCVTDEAHAETLPDWKPGELDLHFIYTGCGENVFYRLPDGTSVLNDTGDYYRPRDLQQVPLLPAADRLGGDWVARYLRRVLDGDVIDYAVFSHWHADHIGHAKFDGDGGQGSDPANAFRYRVTADGRKINGFLCVAEKFGFRRCFDHQYPARGTYRSQDESMALLAPWVEAEKKKGLVVEPFRVGALNQISLLHDPSGYAGSFSVRNVCANGKLWDGASGVRDYAAEHVSLTGKGTIAQNALSMGFVIQYGKFRYWTGGDVSGRFKTRDGVVDYEGLVGERVGPVSLCKMNHHGCGDAMGERFVRAVRAQAYVSCMWCPGQSHPDVLQRLDRVGSYDGRRPLLLPNLVCRWQKDEEAKRGYELQPLGAMHVVVRVAPGGESYRIFLLDAADESMRVKAILERKA